MKIAPHHPIHRAFVLHFSKENRPMIDFTEKNGSRLFLWLGSAGEICGWTPGKSRYIAHFPGPPICRVGPTGGTSCRSLTSATLTLSLHTYKKSLNSPKMNLLGKKKEASPLSSREKHTSGKKGWNGGPSVDLRLHVGRTYCERFRP